MLRSAARGRCEARREGTAKRGARMLQNAARERCEGWRADAAKSGARLLQKTVERYAGPRPRSISAIEKRLAVPGMGPRAAFAVCGGRRRGGRVPFQFTSIRIIGRGGCQYTVLAKFEKYNRYRYREICRVYFSHNRPQYTRLLWNFFKALACMTSIDRW